MSQRLILKPTQEEKAVFGNLFMMIDKEGTNRVEGKEAAEFLRKSGLPKDLLKTIWLMAAKTSPSYLEKEEFYVALRLIALAQNNMEVSEESIRLNHPLPPPPHFNFKNTIPTNSSSVQQDYSKDTSILRPDVSDPSYEEENIWLITEEDENKYQKLFGNIKDEPDSVSIHKLTEMFQNAKMSHEVTNKILNLLPPCSIISEGYYPYKYFRVVFHLIYKKLQQGIDVPNQLPIYLLGQIDPSLVQNVPKPNPNQDFHQRGASSGFGGGPSRGNPSGGFSGSQDLGQGPNINNPYSQIHLDDGLIQSKNFNLVESYDHHPSKNYNQPQSELKLNSEPINPYSAKQNIQQNIQPNIQQNYQPSIPSVPQEIMHFNLDDLDVGDKEINKILEDIVKTCKTNEVMNQKNNETREKILDVRKRIMLEKDKLMKINNLISNRLDELTENQGKYYYIIILELFKKANEDYINFKLSTINQGGNDNNVNINDNNHYNDHNDYNQNNQNYNNNQNNMQGDSQYDISMENRNRVYNLNSNLLPKQNNFQY